MATLGHSMWKGRYVMKEKTTECVQHMLLWQRKKVHSCIVCACVGVCLMSLLHLMKAGHIATALRFGKRDINVRKDVGMRALSRLKAIGKVLVHRLAPICARDVPAPKLQYYKWDDSLMSTYNIFMHLSQFCLQEAIGTESETAYSLVDKVTNVQALVQLLSPWSRPLTLHWSMGDWLSLINCKSLWIKASDK